MTLTWKRTGSAGVLGAMITAAAVVGLVGPAGAAASPITVTVVGPAALLADGRAVSKVDVTCAAGGVFAITAGASQVSYIDRSMASYDGETINGTCTGSPQRLGLMMFPTTRTRPGAEYFGPYSKLGRYGPGSENWASSSVGGSYAFTPRAGAAAISGGYTSNGYVSSASSQLEAVVASDDAYKARVGPAAYASIAYWLAVRRGATP